MGGPIGCTMKVKKWVPIQDTKSMADKEKEKAEENAAMMLGEYNNADYPSPAAVSEDSNQDSNLEYDSTKDGASVAKQPNLNGSFDDSQSRSGFEDGNSNQSNTMGYMCEDSNSNFPSEKGSQYSASTTSSSGTG